MDMQEPVKTEREPAPQFTILGNALVLCILILMIMGIVKLGMVWFT